MKNKRFLLFLSCFICVSTINSYGNIVEKTFFQDGISASIQQHTLLTISLPFWKSWWLTAFMALIVTLMIFFYIRLRTNSLINQNIQLEEKAKLLEERAADWLERFPSLSNDRPTIARDRSDDRIREVELWDLVSALLRIVRLPDVARELSIRMDETPMAVFQEQIRERIRLEGRASFSSFFDGEKHQSRIVGIFLAILEDFGRVVLAVVLL